MYEHSISFDTQGQAEYVEFMVEGELEGNEEVSVSQDTSTGLWVLKFRTPYRLTRKLWLNKANSLVGTFNRKVEG